MEDLKNQIIECINACNLSLEQIFYITKDVYRDVAEQYNIYLMQKAQAPIIENTMKTIEEEPIEVLDETKENVSNSIEMIEPEIIVNQEV